LRPWITPALKTAIANRADILRDFRPWFEQLGVSARDIDAEREGRSSSSFNAATWGIREIGNTTEVLV
jgi:hypothetical protein